MEIKIDTSELDEFQRKLQELDGEHNIPISDLMPDEFVARHSEYLTLNEMLDASGIGEDGDLDSPEFSEFIAQHTQFDDWESMVGEAGAEYFHKKLSE